MTERDLVWIVVTGLCWLAIIRWGIPDPKEMQLPRCDHPRARWDEERLTMCCASCGLPRAVEDPGGE